MIEMEGRLPFSEEHALFRDEVRKFVAREYAPHAQRWALEGNIGRDFWRAAGGAGLLCPGVPENFGGLGLDFRYNAIVNEELAYSAGHMTGAVLQSDILASYIVELGTDEQRERYLPGMISGDVICAIAMTEPSAGSDLKGIRTTARRNAADFVINGSKTYISNGLSADVVIVAAKTDPGRGAKGVTLFLVEASKAGFRRGRKLDKVGMEAADTSELFFDDVTVGADAVLGTVDRGFIQLMEQLPQERLALAITAQGAAQRAFDEAVAYTSERSAFGQRVLDFQNTRFALASLAAQLQIGWAHIDWALMRHVEGKLTTAEASAAKLWHTEMQWSVVDTALQLHGGAGYMNEYAIARLWRDARAQRIFGGTSEIMREIISRSL